MLSLGGGGDCCEPQVDKIGFTAAYPTSTMVWCGDAMSWVHCQLSYNFLSTNQQQYYTV